ncbi:PREDICTED: putative late blight resistance protein homolog R1A-10 [Ipomoea nil]|uniref:putative late blight resistance protein homolog R1A-10 n=1 Tax=Ipomoea nil TaxID=35883 RepID=UPI000901BAC3|nr:PREDICTED: putative late blight resistance protein homolog R1A-10 [Ipomoea nil]
MDTIVDGLINKVAQTVEKNALLILGIKDQVDDLVRELRSLQAYLGEAGKKENWRDNAVLVEVEQSIRNVARDAEDAIDKYIVERRIHKAKPTLKRWAEKAAYYTKVNLSAREIESIKDRAKKIRQDYAHPLQLLQAGSLNNHQPAVLQAPVVEEDDVVGFDGEAKTIKELLTKGSKDTTFISIVGMAGLGKTTLTKMVFNDSDIQYEFFTRLWVYVSRSMNRRQIFMDIISRFTKQTDDFKNVSEELLAESIKEYLKGGKYFIVMDDVWHKKDWDLLKIAFPNNHNGSRVLVTTRNNVVATYADTYAKPHNLKFLEDEECLELLKKKVFRKEAFPGYLEAPGRSIAKKCNGLPLAVVVIAGVLNKDQVSSWNEVAENPMPILNRQTQDYNDILRLSYNQLPSDTKDCFLYLAAFPIGHEIFVWKLIRLWIAEGFIPPSNSTMERTADSYLKEFVSRNLLMVVKRRADGDIKTCRLHDTLHEFCKDEAVKNYLFHEINGARIEANDNYRRLCIRSSLNDFIVSEDKPSGEHIRSLLASDKLDVKREHLATIPKAYPFLKVFDVENVKFEILPKEFYQLYHLRYLAVSTDLKILPKPFTEQWNMETLVFNTSQSIIDVKAEIWKLAKLRHIIANAQLQFPTPQNCKEKCGDLQTLSPISPKSCTEAILEKMPNLLKLGVRGNLVELLDSKGGVCLFDNVGKLLNLQNLKLVHESSNDQSSTIRSFPRDEKFPSKLRKLSLSNTSIDWKHICVLGSLNELEVLKLKESAVKGEYWELNNTVFKSLRFLSIGRTDLVKWTCEKSSFPALNKLYLSHCTSLEAVPLAFKDVKSLKVMELFCTNKKAAASARTIREQKQGDGFDLSIYPPADN